MPLKEPVTVGTPALAAAVGWAAKWVTARPAVPVYAALKLDAADGRLAVTATGDDATARAVVELDGIAPGTGTAIVSGRLLADLTDTLLDSKPTVLTSEGDTLVLTAGRTRLTLPTMPEDEYPAPPARPPTIGAVSGDLLAEAVARVAPAAGRDPSLGVTVSTVHVGMAPGTLTLMATNRYRGARVALPWTADDGAAAEALPLAGLLADAAAAFAGPGDVRIGADATSLALTSPSRAVVLRVLGGEYAADAVRTGLDVEHPHAAEVSVAELAGPLKRAARLLAEKADGKTDGGPVRLVFSPGTLDIRALGDQQTDPIDIDYDGPEIAVGLNPRYLGDALRTAPGDIVRIGVGGTARWPITFCVPGDDAWRHFTMPIRILS